jgi:hypothetical protein
MYIHIFFFSKTEQEGKTSPIWGLAPVEESRYKENVVGG